ncbi:glycosyl transferase [Paractinoplanes abujensis]|uniref:GT2 family glycosyltransferase n=1 Tax=Paractinoplanes abujensis TaxID=882441 RepID=A0A7W7CNH4_9ACTN|nr:glycosyltransferase [Actinoplanes abujensis]MBB4690335.1 GT2 family glycosyltransferase [Actinoplanes abujensis]GID21099.1 glycosyl transferase [Actinoplanes abujensis]
MTTTPHILRTGIETDDVTVVVATRNRGERLLETFPHHRAPAILIDNGSDSPPPALPGARIVQLGENRGAAARNVGVELARTPFVAFADDDSYWTPGALARAAELMRQHPRAALLAARVLVGPQGREDPVSAEMAASPLGTPPGAAGPSVLGFLACSIIVRRDAFLAVGGFEPRLFVYGEEALLAMDLAAAGHQLSYVEELVVRHFPRPGGRDNGARARTEARNQVLTAMLRRPVGVAARTLGAALVTNPRGAVDALRQVGWARRHRRPLPPEVEADLQTLGTTRHP